MIGEVCRNVFINLFFSAQWKGKAYVAKTYSKCKSPCFSNTRATVTLQRSNAYQLWPLLLPFRVIWRNLLLLSRFVCFSWIYWNYIHVCIYMCVWGCIWVWVWMWVGVGVGVGGCSRICICVFMNILEIYQSIVLYYSTERLLARTLSLSWISISISGVWFSFSVYEWCNTK